MEEKNAESVKTVSADEIADNAKSKKEVTNLQKPSTAVVTRFSLGVLANTLSNLRSVCASLVVIILVVLLITNTMKAVLQDVVMIEPIQVPNKLIQRGYTPEVISDRLMEKVLRIRGDIMSQREGHTLAADWLQADFQVPGAGMSVKSMATYLRELFGLSEKRIAGEVTFNQEVMQLRLKLLLKKGAKQILSVESSDVDILLQEAAEKLIETTDPYLMAYYLMSRDPVSSVRLLEYCLDNLPLEDDVWAHNLLGLIHLQNSRFEEAADKFKQAIDLNPQFSLAYSNWGLLLTQRRLYEEADQKFQKAVELNPKLGIVYNGWGVSYAMRGDHENVTKMFQHAVELEPDNPRIYFGWGVALDLLREKKLAMSKLEKSLLLNSGFIEAHYYLGNRYYRDRDYPNAVKHYEVVNQLSPDYYSTKLYNYANALSAWGDALEKQGETSMALEKYEQAYAQRPSAGFQRKLEKLKLGSVSAGY